MRFVLSILILLLALAGMATAQADANAASATPSLTPSLTITPTLTPSATTTPYPPLEISFEGIYSLMLDLRPGVRAALAADRDLLNGIDRYTVSAYRSADGWAEITLVPTALVEAGWTAVEVAQPIVVVARLVDGQWIGGVVGGTAFAAFEAEIPQVFADFSPPPPVEGVYKFPWQNGQDWWAINGWHEGNALDFQPAFDARSAVLAAQAGRLREICSDGYQSLLQIEHADGRSTYYLHVTMSWSVRRTLLDHAVQRGQYLGEIIRQSHFVTPCGQGYSRHLHFVVSDRTLEIDGYSIEQIAASASCCTHPPIYRSTNARIDSTQF